MNQSYAGLLGRSSDHATLRTQLQEARWLIRSLEIRNETLLKVARCIVQRQSAFLEHGDEAHAADDPERRRRSVEMHESTISRVTTNKYMHTPRGVFEFRYFFSSHVAGSDGTGMSSTAIRAKIRKLIAAGGPRQPTESTAASPRSCRTKASRSRVAPSPSIARRWHPAVQRSQASSGETSRSEWSSWSEPLVADRIPLTSH